VDQVRLARQSNRVVRRWPRAQRTMARLLAGVERDRVWRAFVEMYPHAEHYTRVTDRELPLIALEPVAT
jgi:hypothetical protein